MTSDHSFIYLSGIFFSCLIEAISFIILPLILIKYDIRRNVKRIIIFTFLNASAITFICNLPPSIRTILTLLAYLLCIKWCFNLNTSYSFLVLLMVFMLVVINEGILFGLFLSFLNISANEFVSSTALHFVLPWFFVVSNGLLVYIFYKKRLHIPESIFHFKLKASLLTVPAIQLTLLIFIANTITLANIKGTISYKFTILILCSVSSSILLGLYVLWEILRIAGRDVVINAQEQMIQGIQNRIDVIRTHRHDFINHMQILSAFLQEENIDGMKQYILNLNKEIGID